MKREVFKLRLQANPECWLFASAGVTPNQTINEVLPGYMGIVNLSEALKTEHDDDDDDDDDGLSAENERLMLAYIIHVLRRSIATSVSPR